jgi:ribose 5-phosphate isomerase B
MIAIGSDHGGYNLKQSVMAHLAERGIKYKDFGTYSTESSDYPDFGEAVGNAVVSGDYELGIVICGTGIGISIAANKIRGVRAAVCGDCFSAEMSRRHNNANILALGERVTGVGLALKITDIFLETPFDGGRHERRVNKITEIENK